MWIIFGFSKVQKLSELLSWTYYCELLTINNEL